MQDGAINGMTSHLSADIDGTNFSWEGPFPSEEFGGDMTDFAADSDARLESCGFPPHALHGVCRAIGLRAAKTRPQP